MYGKDWILWVDKIVLKDDECIPVWSVSLGGHNSLLETLFIIVRAICIYFYICIQRKFFKVFEFVQDEKCMHCSIQNSQCGILQMVGSHEANMIAGITQHIFSDCHPEPQSHRYNGLKDSHTSKFNISKSNSILLPYISALPLILFNFI